MKRMISGLVVLFALAAVGRVDSSTQPPIDDGDRVILITLDGARHQEIFGGLDREILASTLKAEQNIADQSVYQRFWAETPEERRKKMLPFFWGTWMASARLRLWGITL